MNFEYSLPSGGLATHVEMHFVCSLAWEGSGEILDKIYFVFSLAWVGFDQHKVISILCAR